MKSFEAYFKCNRKPKIVNSNQDESVPKRHHPDHHAVHSMIRKVLYSLVLR